MLSLLVSFLVLLFGKAAELTNKNIFITTAPMNWTDAQKYCRLNHNDLATITNPVANQQLYAIKGNSGSAWIGMYRDVQTRNFQWSDGTSSPFFQWNAKTNQPDLYTKGQNCVEIEPGGWNDQFCYTKRNFFCSRIVVLVEEKMTWEEAFEYCRMNNSSLVSPVSGTQLKLAEMASTQSQTDFVWTGLRFVNGQWIWVSMEPLGDLVSLPSCPAPNYRCGARNGKTRVWENRDCNEKLNFLCYS